MQSKRRYPPSWAVRFLQWFCPPHLYEGIEGDLLEQYEQDADHKGDRAAARRFVWNVFRFLHPEIILRNKISPHLINTIMIGNYLKVASRNIGKRKLYSFINAFGLSIGIAFCILIYLYIEDERSFDKFHENREDIFRMEARSFDTWKADTEDPYNQHAWLQKGLMPTMKDELPEVVKATRFNSDANAVVRYGDKVFSEKIAYVDADFFSMFSFPLIHGNRQRLFRDKHEVVLTPPVVQKYFGGTDPIGKTIVIDHEGEKTFTVTGVIALPPANSSLDFSVLVPQENAPRYERNVNNWGNFNTPTFVQLAPGSDLATFSRNLDKMLNKAMGDKLTEWRKEAVVPIPEEAKLLEYRFTRLEDIHLNAQVHWHKVSDPKYSYILAGIAVLILVIASINYVSLALTTSASRRTEVGIRKSVGAQKSQLIYQFGFESLMLAFLSMIVGIGLVAMFLPAFNEFTDKGIELTTNGILRILGAGLVITLVVGIIAGSYPAFFLSRFHPAHVLKGRFTSRLHAGLTKPLVVLQFALSAFLIISSAIMYRQMSFVTTKNLGFEKENIIVIPTQTGWNDEANKTVEQFRNATVTEPSITSVAGVTSSFNQGYSRYGYKIEEEQKAAYVYGVDPYYIPSLGLELTAGRNFSEHIVSDSNAIIVNEALVRDMGWKNPLEQHLNFYEDSLGQGAKVIGVLKDYHFLSLESTIEPMFLSMSKSHVGYLVAMLVKITPGDLSEKIALVENKWKELMPDRPFDYTFMDQDIAAQYASHQRWMKIMGLSTALAIVIACLGLFGLSGINAVNRTKEIGIRKVMGADLTNIFVLLNRQFVWLALIAFAIATPGSWYAMNKWLSDFEFKVAIGWEIFVISMASGLVIALLTVSYHAFKAAAINPAATLKYE